MFLAKRYVKVLLVLVIMILITPFSAFGANFKVEYRGFEFDFEQFGKKYDFASGLPDKPFEVTDGKHKVKEITPKFDDMNFRDYTFGGWNIKKKGAKIDRTKIYRAGDTIENIASDIQLIAIWKRKEVDIVVSSLHGYLRGGNGDPNIIEGTAPKQTLAMVGDTIKLKQSPFKYDGYNFIGWLDSKGNLYDAGADYTIESFNAIFTATWAADTTVVVKNSVSYSGGENVTGAAPNGFKLYNKNTFTIANNAYKKDGYKFLYWTDGTNNFKPGDTYQVSAQGDIILNAVWEKLAQDFTVTIISTPGGSTTQTGPITIEQGSSFEFTAMPDEGYIIGAIKVDGREISHINGLCRISSVIDDLAITVEFEKQKFNITVEIGEGGTATPDGIQAVEKGGAVTFEIKPNTGFVVEKVLLDGNEQQLTDGKLTLKDIEASQMVKISFKKVVAVSGDVSEIEKTDKVGIIVAISALLLSIFALVTMYTIKLNKQKRNQKRKRH